MSIEIVLTNAVCAEPQYYICELCEYIIAMVEKRRYVQRA